MIYSGGLFPAWQGDAFIGGLSSRSLVRVDLDGATARKGDQWDMGARIREVEQGPDGAIYVLEDGDDGSQGRLIKLVPRG
jgi:glucose/arabinose dehydrogenase